MPIWITHTEGGSWNGGGTEVPNCSLSRRNMIESAFNTFIASSRLNCFPGLEDCLREKFKTIEIDCHDSTCANNSYNGYQSGNKLVLCNSALNAGQNRVNAVLLHELVHACGGKELDSEALEFTVFEGAGATLPSGDDDAKFFSETSDWDGDSTIRKGKWVIWDSQTGEVFGIDKSDGGWNGGSEESKGDRCFIDSDWIISEPGGGW